MLLLLTLLFLISPSSPMVANLCSTSGLCCKHRDSECVVQHVFANQSLDTRVLPCYCDQACIRLDDCCPDYRQFCSVHDCVVSEWGPWSPCPQIDPLTCQNDQEDKDSSGIFITQRQRLILHKETNGGKKCPELIQSKACPVHQCPKQNMHKNAETKMEIPRHKIAKSRHYNEITTSCLEMMLLRASHGCQKHDRRLRVGHPICIECPQDKEASSLECPQLPHVDSSDTTTLRKFRLNRHCHGMVAIINSKSKSQSCGACKEEGLVFRLIN